MKSLSDQQLLEDYARGRSEAAFSELVRRHVDFVYSAALRMVHDAHLAQDVTQSVFLALAQNSPQLASHPVLSGWLHRTALNLAANAVRSDTRRRAREQKAATMNELLAAKTDAAWEEVAPHLDEALGELEESDRDAVLLRYFEGRTAREIAQTLGVSDDAAQKRVSRAVERLREFFARRGVAVGASGLAVVLSANAVHAAPAGLATTISTTAVAVTGTITITTAATTKTIAMTTLQKTLITATIAAAVGTGIFEARQSSRLRTEVQILRQQQAPLAEEIKQLQQQRDEAVAKHAAVEQENERLQQMIAEVPRLRGEVARLRTTQQEPAQLKGVGLDPNDPGVQRFIAAKAVADQISRYLQQMPDKQIPELRLLKDEDWLAATRQAKFDTEAEVRKTLSQLRSQAKQRMFMGSALHAFTRDNNGQLPTDIAQLKPGFKASLKDHGSDVDDQTLDAIFQRYTLLHTGNLNDLPPDAWIIAEKAPVDKDYDSRAKFGVGRSTVIATGIGEAGDPEDKSY